MAADPQRGKFVYDLPYFERKVLCKILDQNKKWEELAGEHMKIDMLTILDLRSQYERGHSPTDELLTLWGHQNHTITELFILLSRMQHYQAMVILKPFVDQEHHRLIYEGEENLHRFFGSSVDKQTVPRVRNPAQVTPSAPSETNDRESGAVAGAQRRTTEKTLNFGSHNLNVSSNLSQSDNKMLLPTSSAHEEKILNTAHNVVNSVGPRQELDPSAAAAPSRSPSDRQHNLGTDNKKYNIPQPNQIRKLSNASNVSSVVENCGSIPQIEYEELMKATKGWDKSTIIGKGGFGTVHKGIWKNTLVAIKKIEQKGEESGESYQVQMEQSLRELRILNSVRHDNVLPLYGFSIGGDEPCLVYQFMPNGSVEDRLICRGDSKPLSWQQRHHIAEGSARGLQFLHDRSKPFIHGDIKSANILLDINFEPRIGDFGLAREGPQNQYTHLKVSRVHGTRPYLPHEFLRGKQMSTKVDTYSFGVVLFELATGLRAYDSKQHKFLKDRVEKCEESQLHTLIDKKAGPEDFDTFNSLICLGKQCVRNSPKERPEMVVALKQLEGMGIKREILNRAQHIAKHGSSAQPMNPYDLQAVHDYMSQQRRLSATTPTSQPSGPPMFCNGNSPSPLPVMHMHGMQLPEQPPHFPANYIHRANYVQYHSPNGPTPVRPTLLVLPTNPFLDPNVKQQLSVQQEVDEEHVPVGLAKPNPSLIPMKGLSLTIPNSHDAAPTGTGASVSPRNYLLQPVNQQRSSGSPSVTPSVEMPKTESEHRDGCILPATIDEHNAVTSPPLDEYDLIPLISALGIKEPTAEQESEPKREVPYCSSHHYTTSFIDSVLSAEIVPTARGKDLGLFDM